MPTDEEALSQTLQTTRIITCTLVAGLLTFLTVTIIVGRSGAMAAKAPVNTPILSYVAVAFAGIFGVASVVVPNILTASGRQAIAANLRATQNRGTQPAERSARMHALVALFQSSLIVRLAMREGFGFFALIAYMLEGSPIALGVGVLAILAVAICFPTRSGLEQWLEEQSRALDES
jgi:hypothetical protein